MKPIRASRLVATGFVIAGLASPGLAQEETLTPLPELPSVAPVEKPMTPAEVSALPEEYQSLPTTTETSTSTGVDGLETITRTRRIVSRAPAETLPAQAIPPAPATSPYAQYTYYTAGYAPAYAPMVLDNEQWLAECRRRTEGRSDKEKGGIIGALLGAIGGGIAGNELAGAGDALGGTLIGAGVGGLAGLFIGNLIAGDGDKDEYDCEGALAAYLDQYGKYGARFASRTIPAGTPPLIPLPTYPAYNYGYAYPQPAATYYPAQQTVAMVPITSYQNQRVVVRETVREEMVPGAVRTIPPAPPAAPQPLPSPKLIKQSPASPAPSPKLIKN
ncbi:MAG: hypothetical protein AAGH57_02985 [Pseudomonadota bacterium]